MHGNFYGTPRGPVEKVLAQGRDMLFDVDWQGARQMRERLGDDRQRLRPAAVDARVARAAGAPGRGSTSSIGTRLDNARREIERWRNYHYVIVNDDLQRGYRDVVAIVTAERLRCARVEAGIERFVAGLMGE